MEISHEDWPYKQFRIQHPFEFFLLPFYLYTNKNNFLEKQWCYSRVSEITRAGELFHRAKIHAVIDSHISSHLPVRSWQLLHSSAGPWIFPSSLSPHPSYSWLWQLKQQCIFASDVQRLDILDWVWKSKPAACIGEVFCRLELLFLTIMIFTALLSDFILTDLNLKKCTVFITSSDKGTHPSKGFRFFSTLCEETANNWNPVLLLCYLKD